MNYKRNIYPLLNYEEFPFNKAVMPQTKVFKLVVENMTGKMRKKNIH